MKHQKGFSMIEVLITASVLLMVLLVIYDMALYHGEISKTENSNIRLQQEARFLLSSFATEIKNSGAIITLADTSIFLGRDVYFNGIFPINSDKDDAFPDGLIIATGDPDAATKLEEPWDPTEDGSVIKVKNIDIWNEKDKGIIVGPEGYYVFIVDSKDDLDKKITMRPTSIYHSGLLNSGEYLDPTPTPGDQVEYPEKCLVTRLTNFKIYLFRQKHDFSLERDIRQLVCVTDAKGEPDLLDDEKDTKKTIISENIYDLQISYVAYQNFQKYPDIKTEYFEAVSSTGTLDDLLTDIRSKNLKELKITIVSLTDEFSGTGKIQHKIPSIADQNPYVLPTGKYNFKVINFLVHPKNYSIAI